MQVTELRVDPDSLRAACQRFGIARLELFGSAARGQLGPTSDIDLLYELLPGQQIAWNLMYFAEELESMFGRPVDLVARRSIHPLLRDEILNEAQQFYAA